LENLYSNKLGNLEEGTNFLMHMTTQSWTKKKLIT
jgi:hypothetical protein